MNRRRRLTGISIGTIAVSLLASTGAWGVQMAGVARAAEVDPVPPAASATATAMGAYLTYGADGVRRIEQFSRWLGGAQLRVGHTYLPGDRWSNIEGAPLFLRDWAHWRRSAADRMLVLNVPMMERNEARLSDWEVARLLRAGAAGHFDHHFRTLAERLVNLGVPDTVIVLGWEMNGTTYSHRCGPDPRSWRTYWKRIVTTMRSVPGQSFRFDFAPNRGTDAIPWTDCYPGDEVVDIIGMDSYDQAPGKTFEEQASAPYGLYKQVEFAAAHNKQISYPEWGLFRNGDNPDYMRGMLEWIARHKPLYQTITDYCPHGVWQCGNNPESSKVYRSMLLGQPGTVPTIPPVPTVPPLPTPFPTPSVPTPTIPTPSAPPPFQTPFPTPSAPTPAAPSAPAPSAPAPSAPVSSAPTPSVPAPSVTAPAQPTPQAPTPSTPVPSTPVPSAPAPSASAPSVTPTPTATSAAPTTAPTPAEPSPTTPTPTATPTATPTPTPTVAPEEPAPAPTPTPTPTALPSPLVPVPLGPVAPLNSRKWCVPLDLGDWISRWVSKDTFCVTVPWPATWPFGTNNTTDTADSTADSTNTAD